MFTSSDRKAITSAISKADAVKKDLITVNSRVNTLNSTVSSLNSTVNTAVSKIISASSTAVGAKAQADEAMSTAVGAKERADEAMEGVTDLRSYRNDLGKALNSTGHFLQEVAANVNDNLPAMKTSIQNLQNDMNAIKLSVLVQTCSELGTQQGDLRLYTSEECDAMNGNYNPNGECLKKEGGSFSYDCGMLYKGKNVGSKKVNNTAVKNNTGMEYATAVKNNKGMEYGTGMEYGEVQETNKRKNYINSIIHDDGGRQREGKEQNKKNNSNPANSFNTSKPFNWSKEPGGQSDVTGTAFRVAAKMGLRASIASETEKFGWSLPIGSEFGLEAMQEADNTFMASLENNLSLGEAARLAQHAAAETEDRISLVNASLRAAHRLGLGSKTVNQTSTGWSLPLGQYSSVEAVAADQAFQKKIAAAATPYAPTEQEGRAAAEAALIIVKLRRIAFDMGLGVMGKTLGKTRAPSSIALYGYSLPNGTYTVEAATAADAAFEAAYLAGASPAEAADAAQKAAGPQPTVLGPSSGNFSALAASGAVAANAAPGAVAANAKAAMDRWGAWAGTLFKGLGGRRKRTTRGKSRRRGTRRSRR